MPHSWPATDICIKTTSTSVNKSLFYTDVLYLIGFQIWKTRPTTDYKLGCHNSNIISTMFFAIAVIVDDRCVTAGLF